MTTECVVEIGLETHFETWNFFTILDVYTHQLSAHIAFFSYYGGLVLSVNIVIMT